MDSVITIRGNMYFLDARRSIMIQIKEPINTIDYRDVSPDEWRDIVKQLKDKVDGTKSQLHEQADNILRDYDEPKALEW